MRSRRHYLLLVPAAALIGLAGCGGSDSDTAVEASTTEVAAESSTTAPPADEDVADDTDVAENGEPDDRTTEADDEVNTTSALEGFEERVVLERTVPDLGTLRSIVETDNPDTRVILFEDASGRKVYKSVFVKHGQRLKVLDLDGGPPLFNERI